MVPVTCATAAQISLQIDERAFFVPFLDLKEQRPGGGGRGSAGEELNCKYKRMDG